MELFGLMIPQKQNRGHLIFSLLLLLVSLSGAHGAGIPRKVTKALGTTLTKIDLALRWNRIDSQRAVTRYVKSALQVYGKIGAGDPDVDSAGDHLLNAQTA